MPPSSVPPPQKGAREPGRTGSPAGWRASAAWAWPLTLAAHGASRAPARASRRARAGGAGGGRAAIVAILRSGSSRAGRRALHHPPRGRRAGAGVATRGDFLPQGGAPNPLAQRPGRGRARLGFHFFKRKFSPGGVCARVCARARCAGTGQALTVAINEQTVRVGPGTREDR